MKKIIYAVLSFSPIMAFAQAAPTPQLGFLVSIVKSVGDAVKLIIPIMFALAIIYFFWGLIKFIQSAGDPVAAGKGKSIMIYGVIAIAVMGSIYGLVAWLQGATGINPNATVNPPTVQGL